MSQDIYANLGGQNLPQQKLPMSSKDKEWGKSCINYYSNYRYTNGSNLRSDRLRKLINYDLYNGKVNHKDIETICDPLGINTSNTFPARFQHYDIISEPIKLLIGEETKRPDNHIVVSESPDDINRKTSAIKEKIFQALQQGLAYQIDPNADPNNPPPPPEEIIKHEKYTPSDIIESKANKILKSLKKKCNTRLLFSQGWKDALIAGEEVYWVGIENDEVAMRRVNPVNLTVILDGDTTFIDDAIAVVEERMLAINTILDEYGDILTKEDVDKLENYTRGTFGSFNTAGGFEPQFDVVNGQNAFAGITPTNAYNGNNSNNYSIRVTRVEWKSMKKIGELTWTDEEGIANTEIVDEFFKTNIFKQAFPDAKVEWYWINEAWEGVKIGLDIFTDIKPKPNQRRRLDNPYYCRLGYTGFIYEATNSQSVSLIDRLKPYQYLYDIISYRLEIAFASDQGKKFIMDLAQIPQSQGIDIDKWMYYLKEMNIAFINSFEEGKKGAATGQLANKFNQFQAIDLSLSQSIQQYINMLDYIKQQVAFVSGVTPQRLGAINNSELVGNVERSVNQSSLITEYLYEAHAEVKRRAYTAMIEVAKICYKKGLVAQYVLDDMGIEMLNLEENEFENSEFNVFVTNNTKDLELKAKLDQLVQVALQSEKIDLSSIVETLMNDSPRDIVRLLQRKEEEFYKRQADSSKAQQEHEMKVEAIQQQMHAEQVELDHLKLDQERYIAEANNSTKIQIAEIGVFARQQDLDQNDNGIPDPSEIAANALKQQELSSKAFLEQSKIGHDKSKHDAQLAQKDKEIRMKQDLENKKLEQIKIQNKNQIELANKKAALDKDMMNKKMEIERMKLAAAKAKSNKPKK
jgi:hypothetical protein